MNKYNLSFKSTDKVIEFGGGSNPLFHPNYDIRQLPNVDKVIDLNYPLSLDTYSFDGVYSSYLLEHLSWRNVRNFLKEIHRILKVGGKLLIKTSNLLEQARVIVNSPSDKWNDDLIGLIYGGQDYGENAHQCGFSPEYLKKILKEIGFDDIKITPIYSDFGPTDMQIEAITYYYEIISGQTVKTTGEEVINKNIIKPLKTIIGVNRSQWILQHCKLGKKILDIGSNKGHVFEDSIFVKDVTSIDLDVYDLPNFYQMDAHDLKFDKKSFDIGNLAEILEHVEDPVQVLKEANRVCKKLLITVPDELNWAKELFPFETLEEAVKRKNKTIEQLVMEGNPTVKELYAKDNHRHIFHNRHYTEETLRQDLEKAGIKGYYMDRLVFDGWSFFVIETKEGYDEFFENGKNNQVINVQTSVHNAQIQTPKGPVITIGSNMTEDKKDKLRIALISTPFFGVPPKKYGGLEQILWDLAEALDELGHKVTIFAPEGSQTPKHGHLIITGQSLDTVNIDWLQTEKNNYEIYSKIITPDKFDIVHGCGWFGFEYLLKQQYPNLKILHQHHGGYSWKTPPPVKYPNLVAISQFMQKYTEQYFKQKGFDIKSEYVYNGIDLSKYKYYKDIRTIKTDRLLFVGRLSTFKQPHIAVEVARKTNYKLDIIGGTFVDNDQYVIQLDKIVENEPNIKIYKDTPHEFKIKKMQEAKALLFPSAMQEPFGLVAVEAMACGTPVIALNDGAISEVVIHNKTGYICNDVQEIVDSINKIQTINPEDCRKRAEEFSRLNMAKNYLNLYKKILNGEEW